jgi:hypothetical protein
MVRANNWRSSDKVMAAAKETRPDAPALHEHVLRLGSKRLDEALALVWEMEGGGGEPQVDRVARLQEQAASAACVCAGRWQPAAQRLLQIQGLDSRAVRSVVVRALRWGRRKWTNLLIVGRAHLTVV